MQVKNTSKTPNHSSNGKVIPVVAIGASSGGLEAVTELLQNLSAETGFAFVYVQHLDPKKESLLPTILSKGTKMKVQQVKHLMQVKGNQVYIIPPGRDMTIVNNTLMLHPRTDDANLHMSIDKFFLSLAQRKNGAAVGIVLSGAASDGTIGLKAIKAAGGLTFAQDSSAKFQSMPKSAVAEAAVDLVLKPSEMATQLEHLSRQTPAMVKAMQKKEDDDINNDERDDLLNIIQLLKKSVGVDFSHYKIATVRRRIIRRMLLYKLNTLSDYTKYLKQHASEINVLYEDLLIHVTSFFRDPDALEYLKKRVLPKIIKSKSRNEPLRIWIPACSTGEEAYSVAIVLMEMLNGRTASTAVQIFATDLSENSINKARLGVYSKSDLSNVSPRRIQRFFTKVDNEFRVIKQIRDLCVFAPHNIFRDPPFSRMDFISCCNMLIYLEPVLQKKVVATFHYALNDDGILMLGKSETIGASAQLFTQLEKKYKIYIRKNDAASSALFEMSHRLPEVGKPDRAAVVKVRPKVSIKSDGLEKAVDDILMSKYVPASVLVNHELDILQFRGSTGLFLEPAPGKASLNLLKMARSGLAFELRNIVHKADRSGKAVKKSGLEIKYKGAVHHASIEAIPLKPQYEERLFLIVFEEITHPAAGDVKLAFSKDKLVKQLRGELNTLRDDMRTIVEEQEAGNEELQSANEEIISSNEELQSINEELETSKEEVESTNEELLTINQELQVRNDQLSESYDYAQSVFDTIREAVLVLDKDLRVKSANNAFYESFRVHEQETEGKLVYELGSGQWNTPEMHELFEQIIPRNLQCKGYEITRVFPIIGERTVVLNAQKIYQKIHRLELTLLAIEDITEHRNGQKIIAEREQWFRETADNAPAMIWVADANMQRTFYNKTWLQFRGRTLEQESGAGWQEGVYDEDREQFIKMYEDAFIKQKPFKTEYRLKRYDGEYRWILSAAKPTFNSDGAFTGFIGTCTEIHDQRLQNEELEQRVKQRTTDLEEAIANLARSNRELEQFAYVASHDLQEPLRKIITFGSMLEQRFKSKLPEGSEEYLDKMKNSATRMSQLISELLNFSKVLKPDEKFVQVSLNDVVKDALKDFDLNEKKVKIKVADLPVISAVAVQMAQLFHNLLSNAFKFTATRATPEITITCEVVSPGRKAQYPALKKQTHYYEITLIDNGIGFNPKYDERIFVIFQRLHEKDMYPGTGIGLALCKKIADYHNGIIYAQSEEDKGASFHIILPAEQ